MWAQVSVHALRLTLYAPELHLAHVLWKQVEIGARILHKTERPLRAKHETARADGAKELRKLILRRTPDPRNVPQHALLLARRQSPVHFLDHVATGGRHDETHSIARARECADRRRAQVAGDVERVALAQILETHGEHERHVEIARGE